MMNSSADPTGSIARLEEDAQPSPKRRKNAPTNSCENGYSNASNNIDKLSGPPSACQDSIASKVAQAVDNGKNVSPQASTLTTTATATPDVATETDTSREATQKSVSGTVVVNGAARAENANEESQSANGKAETENKGQPVRRNQFGEESDGHMSIDDWLEQWRNGKTRFTMKVPHRMLVKHHDELVDGKTNPVFFIPCCGKSLDIKWLADKGHKVVGVEIAEMACRQFFDRHDLKFDEETIKEGPTGKVFKAIDCDITLYACDFFSVTSDLIGQFDCIWDRGSYAAMNPADRQKYYDVISKLLKKDGRYLLDCFELEHSVFAGPPHTTDPKDLESLFDAFDVKQIEHVDAMNDWTRSWGVKFFYQNDFILTHKIK